MGIDKRQGSRRAWQDHGINFHVLDNVGTTALGLRGGVLDLLPAAIRLGGGRGLQGTRVSTGAGQHAARLRHRKTHDCQDHQESHLCILNRMASNIIPFRTGIFALCTISLLGCREVVEPPQDKHVGGSFYDFEEDVTGKTPAGFTTGLTGKGGPVRWEVQEALRIRRTSSNTIRRRNAAAPRVWGSGVPSPAGEKAVHVRHPATRTEMTSGNARSCRDANIGIRGCCMACISARD